MQFDGFRCPKCGEQVDVRSGSDQTGVTSITAGSGCESAGDGPVEVVDFSLRFAIARSVWSGGFMTTLLAGIIVSIMIAINVFEAIGGNFQRLSVLPRVALMFFGFSWCFIAVVGFPLAFFLSRRWRPRRIGVNENELVVETVAKTVEMSLEECFWFVSNFGCDKSGFYFPNSPVIIVQTRPEHLERGQELLSFACGFSDQSFKMWSEFLTESCEKRTWKKPIRTLLLAMAVGSTLGGVLALLIGLGLEEITGIPRLAASIAFLGWLDGGVAAVFWSCLGFWRKEDWDSWLKKHMSPLLLSLSFALIGLKIGVMAGWAAAVPIAVTNSLVGLAIGLYSRKRFSIRKNDDVISATSSSLRY